MLITLSKFSIFWGVHAFKVQIARRSCPHVVDNLKIETPCRTIQTHMKKSAGRGEKREEGKKGRKEERKETREGEKERRRGREEKKRRKKTERPASLGRDDRGKSEAARSRLVTLSGAAKAKPKPRSRTGLARKRIGHELFLPCSKRVTVLYKIPRLTLGMTRTVLFSEILRLALYRAPENRSTARFS